MENRRLFALKRDPALGSSTLIPPQLEQHSLFLKPHVTQKLREEYSKRNGEDFGIVINVGNAKPSEVEMLYGEGDVVEVKIRQPPTPFGDMTFARDCSYRYEMPRSIDKTTLKALKTRDNYLIIVPDSILRESWEDSMVKEDSAETRRYSNFAERVLSSPFSSPCKKDATLPEKETQGTVEGPRSEGPMVVEEQTETREISEDELRKRREISDGICPPGSALGMTEMDRNLRPCLDLLILRRRLLDIERFVYRMRRFVENSSFIVEDKLTVERVVYSSARQSQRYYKGEDVLQLQA
ncbi:uncharacterized protein TNCT_678331 [Trichonephila clavata]|uniref:Uncharacterized protein n=1 Tax=Trichonephila clavata TaxID=2740835 RepID=A0A8X6GPB4_TRICU|nr:uncharacterized protein TNCT_678331 [Trichonephila clavata]